MIGGGTGHEPCFLGYVGKGLADAVAVGNIFSSPPRHDLPVRQCRIGRQGVLFVYGNYAGDVMNSKWRPRSRRNTTSRSARW